MVVFYNQSKYDEKSEYRISKSETCIQRLSATLGFKGFGRCFKI